MIDAHVHVWTLDAERYPWQPTLKHVPIPTAAATAEDLLAEMDGAGVEVAVLVQPSVYGWDNSYLCDSLDRHPGRFAGVCLVDPRSELAAADLRHWCAERGCRGLRVNLVGGPEDASWILGDLQAQLFGAARELGIAVELQTLPSHVDAVCELARGFEAVTFVIDYLGGAAFHDGTGAPAAERLAREPNIGFKLLSLSQDSREPFPFADLFPLYERAAAAFGANRMVFGTDFPHARERSDYGESVRWLEALPFLGPAERALVADHNARGLFGITSTREEER
jgi:predicted TIM-barrel fold metal-dependent hydrolase